MHKVSVCLVCGPLRGLSWLIEAPDIQSLPNFLCLLGHKYVRKACNRYDYVGQEEGAIPVEEIQKFRAIAGGINHAW